MSEEILVWLDFETYSEVDIKAKGGMAYVLHDSTNPICLTWAIGDGPVQLWTPRDPDPEVLFAALENGAYFYAHNMKFDIRVWKFIMTRDFGWPMLNIAKARDSQALCASYGLPLALDKAGAARKIKMPKAATGKALIKLLCSPNKKGGQPMWNDPVYQAKFREFFAYGKRDVEAMRELVGTLPRNHLIPQEHDVWELTYNMNCQGLPIAFDEVTAIREYLDKYIATKMPEVNAITGGAIQKVTQTVKIKQWINDQGYGIPDTTAETVELALEDPVLAVFKEDVVNATTIKEANKLAKLFKVRRLLELRQELGKSSVAKFNKLIDQAIPDENGQYWVYDNLEFHGAGPGRWSGRGFQMQNLPRFKLKDPEPVIAQFMNNEVIDNPVLMAKGLIRPSIKAPKDHKLVVHDYDSIENKVLHWLADDKDAIEDFKRGVDQYITMASARYHVEYKVIKEGCALEVTMYKDMRQMGKVIILGAGFGMGWETFIRTAKSQFGMDVDEQEARAAIIAYRDKYYLVKKLWADLKTAAARAVLTGKRQTVRLITFGLSVVNGTPWLAMRLPSGKCVYYCQPKVEARYIPGYEEMGKVPTVTHLGRHPKTGQWLRIPLIPGRITENAVQGTAREIMARGLLNTQERMPELKILGTVHDEGLGLVHMNDLTDDTLDTFAYHLCDIPWAKDCPITASGYIADRYKKD